MNNLHESSDLQFDNQPMHRCSSAQQTITVYDKENRKLRPHLRKYKNVEQHVGTQKFKDITYQVVTELTDPVHDVVPLPDDCMHVSLLSFK